MKRDLPRDLHQEQIISIKYNFYLRKLRAKKNWILEKETRVVSEYGEICHVARWGWSRLNFLSSFSARIVKPSWRQFNGVARRSLLRAVLCTRDRYRECAMTMRIAAGLLPMGVPWRAQPLRPFPIYTVCSFLFLFYSLSFFILLSLVLSLFIRCRWFFVIHSILRTRKLDAIRLVCAAQLL